MLAFFRGIIGSGAAISAIPPGVLGGATIVLSVWSASSASGSG